MELFAIVKDVLSCVAAFGATVYAFFKNLARKEEYYDRIENENRQYVEYRQRGNRDDVVYMPNTAYQNHNAFYVQPGYNNGMYMYMYNGAYGMPDVRPVTPNPRNMAIVAQMMANPEVRNTLQCLDPDAASTGRLTPNTSRRFRDHIDLVKRGLMPGNVDTGAVCIGLGNGDYFIATGPVIINGQLTGIGYVIHVNMPAYTPTPSPMNPMAPQYMYQQNVPNMTVDQMRQQSMMASYNNIIQNPSRGSHLMNTNPGILYGRGFIDPKTITPPPQMRVPMMYPQPNVNHRPMDYGDQMMNLFDGYQPDQKRIITPNDIMKEEKPSTPEMTFNGITSYDPSIKPESNVPVSDFDRGDADKHDGVVCAFAPMSSYEKK